MPRSLTRLAAPALAAALLLPAAAAAHQSPGHRDFDIEAHRGGLAYTLDDPQLMQHVIDLGVDGIISDDPLTLIDVAKRNGLR
jgi:glycerophosphoryl diester phosphodiesterase